MDLRTINDAAREFDAAERAVGFDRVKAERDLTEVMRSLGFGMNYIPSCEHAVVPYAYDLARLIDTYSIQSALELRGHKIAGIAKTDWIDGTGDGEVLAVAFDVPCLDLEWRTQATGPKP